jgi:hypothetical protein
VSVALGGEAGVSIAAGGIGEGVSAEVGDGARAGVSLGAGGVSTRVGGLVVGPSSVAVGNGRGATLADVGFSAACGGVSGDVVGAGTGA